MIAKLRQALLQGTHTGATVSLIEHIANADTKRQRPLAKALPCPLQIAATVFNAVGASIDTPGDRFKLAPVGELIEFVRAPVFPGNPQG